MSAITAASIKYSEPFRTAVGGVFFTATNIEVAATTEEYLEGGVELKPESLGFVDGLISVGASVGGTASGVPGAIWCNPVATLNKETYETGKQVAEACLVSIVVIAGIPWLRVYAQETAGIGKPLIEAKTSTKQKLGKFSVTVYAYGK